MKSSDSTNSLTALTEVVTEVDCFICLEHEHESGESLVDSNMLRTCGCKFVVHPQCWNKWVKNKTDWDCPICHKKSLQTLNIAPNPTMTLLQRNIQMNNYISSNRSLFIFTGVIVTFSLGIIIALSLSISK
jgi:hypothetical protein